MTIFGTIVKRWYDSGMWNKEQVMNLLETKAISEDDYREIVGDLDANS